VLPFFAIVRAATTPTPVFALTGRSKVVWVVLPLVFGFLAAAYFFAFVYPGLKAASQVALDVT
jgi:hypothetical protein